MSSSLEPPCRAGPPRGTDLRASSRVDVDAVLGAADGVTDWYVTAAGEWVDMSTNGAIGAFASRMPSTGSKWLPTGIFASSFMPGATEAAAPLRDCDCSQRSVRETELPHAHSLQCPLRARGIPRHGAWLSAARHPHFMPTSAIDQALPVQWGTEQDR